MREKWLLGFCVPIRMLFEGRRLVRTVSGALVSHVDPYSTRSINRSLLKFCMHCFWKVIH